MGKVSARPPPPRCPARGRGCAGWRGGGNASWSVPAPCALRDSIGRADTGAGGPVCVRCAKRERPGSGTPRLAEGGVSGAAGFGPALSDKEPAWGRGSCGVRSPPPPAPHVKRNNLFILGFKNPALLPAPEAARLLLSPLPPGQDAARSRRQRLPPPPAPPLPSSSPGPSGPPSPSLLERGRGGGCGRRFVRLAALLSPGRPVGRGAAPAALPPPPPPAACAKKGPTRLDEPRSQSRGGSFSLYKQEAKSH